MNSSNDITESLRPFSRQTLDHLRTAVVATLVLAVLVCGVYPAIVWGLAQALFPRQANGSLIKRDGTAARDASEAVGSALLGQPFAHARYFHPRPSAAGKGYDPTSSGGSNLGPLSAKLLNGTTRKDEKGNDVVDFDGVHIRIVHYCVENGIPFTSSLPMERFEDASGRLEDVKLIEAFNDDRSPLVFTPKVPIPPDAVTASASGLDPHISPENARMQAPRVAAARKMALDAVLEWIGRYTEDRGLGEPGVNVLRLNLALDGAQPGTIE